MREWWERRAPWGCRPDPHPTPWCRRLLGEGPQFAPQVFLWSGDPDSLWDGWIHRHVRGLGDHPLALAARLGITALMNIEFLDEAGTSLPPLSEKWEPLAGGGSR